MRKAKTITAAVLAAVLSASLPFTGVAGPASVEADGTGASADALSDNRLEYSEVGGRIENYNSEYKKIKSQFTSGYLSNGAAGDLTEEAAQLLEEAKDLKSDDMDEETRRLYESYKETAGALRKQAQKLSNAELPSGAEKTLRQMKNKLAKTVEGLLIQYQTVAAQAELADKGAELAAAAAESKARMAELGMSSAEEVLAAQKSFYEAQSGAQAAHAGLQNLRQNILILLGWDADAPVEIVPIGEPDLTRLASMNPDSDRQAAVWANYELQGIKGASASGSSDRSVKKRNVSLTEQSVSSQVERMYAEVAAKKLAYEASQAEFAAAGQMMAAADRKNSLGMIGKLEYLSEQVKYLQARAAKESASMALFKAMEDYDWAVKGLI